MRIPTAMLLVSLLAAGALSADSLPATATDVSAAPDRISGAFNDCLVLGVDGTVYGIGYNNGGRLTGSADSSTLTPFTGLPSGVRAVRISAGEYDSLVIGSNGVVYGAGINNDMELTGSGKKTTLTPLAGLPDNVVATGIAAGSRYSLVLGSDGVAYGAGENFYGQLTGTGGRSVLTPLAGLPDGVWATGVAAGYNTSLVLASDGAVYGAGDNARNQLSGSGNKNVLTALTGLPNEVTAVRIAAGTDATLVLGSDGAVYGTGSSLSGQLTGTTSRTTLTALTGLPTGVSATAISAGASFSLVLGSDGAAYGTGDNVSGQLTGNVNSVTTLTPMAGLPGGVSAAGIAAGYHHSLVVGSDGAVYGTGNNDSHQLSGTGGKHALTLISGQVLANSVSPSIQGASVVGSTLTASPGSWTPTPTAFDYQWNANGIPIDGASAASFTITDSQLGAVLSVTVSVSREGFTAGSATSTETSAASAVPAAIVAPAKAKVKFTFSGLSKITSARTGGKVKVTVTAAGHARVTGKVVVYDVVKKGKKTTKKKLVAGSLKNSKTGKITIRLHRLKPGKHTIIVRYLGSQSVAPATSGKKVIRVHLR